MFVLDVSCILKSKKINDNCNQFINVYFGPNFVIFFLARAHSLLLSVAQFSLSRFFNFIYTLYPASSY